MYLDLWSGTISVILSRKCIEVFFMNNKTKLKIKPFLLIANLKF